jgi:hypothetical protein
VSATAAVATPERITVGGLLSLYESLGDVHQYLDALDTLLGVRTAPSGREYRDRPKINPTDYSFTDLCEAFCGRRYLQTLKQAPYGLRGGRAVTNPTAEQARENIGGGSLGPSQFMNINAFSGTVGGLLGASYMDGYNSANFIGDRITSLKTNIRGQNQKRVRYSPATNKPTVLKPGQEIPRSNIEEDWIRDTAMVRRGESVALTREAVHFDWTDGLVESAKDNGYQFREDREERQLKAVFGVVNFHERKGVASNTYLAAADAGAFVNKITNALVDEISLDNAFQTLANMTDPITGKKIDVTGDQLFLISTAYKRGTASRLARSTQHRFGDGAAATDAVYVPKDPILEFTHEWTTRAVDLMTPAAPGGLGLTQAQAQERWVYGNTRKAFQTIEAWPFITQTFTIGEDASLMRYGIFVEVIGEEYSEVTVIEPRYALLCIKDA